MTSNNDARVMSTVRDADAQFGFLASARFPTLVAFQHLRVTLTLSQLASPLNVTSRTFSQRRLSPIAVDGGQNEETRC